MSPTSQSLLEVLLTPTSPGSGSWRAGSHALRWDPESITLTRHHESRTFGPGDARSLNLQLSRAARRSTPGGFLGKLLRRTRVTYHLHVELRSPHGRLRLSAPTEDPGLLVGLPILASAAHDLPWSDLLGLLRTATELGARTTAFEPDFTPLPTPEDAVTLTHAARQMADGWSDPDARPTLSSLVPHIEVLLETVPLNTQSVDLHINWGRFELERGANNQAAAILANAWTRCNTLRGEHHPRTLLARSIYAEALIRAGRPDDALRHCVQAARGRNEVLGATDSLTQEALLRLALALHRLERYSEALPHLQQVLTTRQKNLGEAHPDSLDVMQRLANTLQAMHAFHEAIPIWARLATLQENRHANPNHDDVWYARRNLAEAHGNLGQHWKKIEIFEKLEDHWGATLGPHHPDTLAVVSAIGSSYYALERYDDALPLQLDVLEQRQRLLGPDHVNTLSAQNNVAVTFYMMQHYERALAHFEPLHTRQARVYGETHEDTLETAENIARCRRALDNP